MWHSAEPVGIVYRFQFVILWSLTCCGSASADYLLACRRQPQKASTLAGGRAPVPCVLCLPCAVIAEGLQWGPACTPPGATLNPGEGVRTLSSMGFVARDTCYGIILIVNYSPHGKLQTSHVTSNQIGFLVMACFSVEQFFHFNNLIFSVYLLLTLKEVFSAI